MSLSEKGIGKFSLPSAHAGRASRKAVSIPQSGNAVQCKPERLPTKVRGYNIVSDSTPLYSPAGPGVNALLWASSPYLGPKTIASIKRADCVSTMLPDVDALVKKLL